MAFSLDANYLFGNGNESSELSTDWGLSYSASAGKLVILQIAMNNLGTTDGQTSQLTNVTDSVLNQWTKAGEYTNTLGGAAADGSTIAVWYSVLTNNLTAGTHFVTTTYSGNLTAKAVSAIVYSIGAGNTVSVAGSVEVLSNDNSDAGSQSISGLASKEYLFYRAIASETDANNTYVGFTLTAGYSTNVLSPRSGTGGSEKLHICTLGEHIIATATGHTSNPTLPDTTSDNASLFIAFQETAPAVTSTVTSTDSTLKTDGVSYSGGSFQF
jgi:hypothetical protein